MKAGKKARDVRKEAAAKRKAHFLPAPAPAPSPAPAPAASPPALSGEERAAREEAETREFLAWLQDTQVVPKEELPAARRGSRQEQVRSVNLEDGMPTVEEAVRRLHTGLQAARCDHVGTVRLIHGYGSTGKGGRIRVQVRAELGRLKRQGAIRDYVPGEEFGPFSEAGRRLVSRYPQLARDRDYGRENQGITMVVL